MSDRIGAYVDLARDRRPAVPTTDQPLHARGRWLPASVWRADTLPARPALARLSAVLRVFPWRYWRWAGREPSDGLDRTDRRVDSPAAQSRAIDGRATGDKAPPFWAALIVRLNQRLGTPFGFLNPFLYGRLL